MPFQNLFQTDVFCKRSRILLSLASAYLTDNFYNGPATTPTQKNIFKNDVIMALCVHGVIQDCSEPESNCVALVRYRLPSEDYLLSSLDQGYLQKNTHF